MSIFKTSELSGAALDWAVAKCEGYLDFIKKDEIVYVHPDGTWFRNCNWQPSTNWSQGGPIIERERLYVTRFGDDWQARSYWHNGYKSFVHVFMCEATDSSLLVAAMRCYVASKLGDVVEIPESLAA